MRWHACTRAFGGPRGTLERTVVVAPGRSSGSKALVNSDMVANGQSVHIVPSRVGEVTTLAVDDHAAFRDVLRDLIDAAPGFFLVGEARSGEEATRAVDVLAPQFVLMDVTMPGMGGIAAAREIVSRHPEVVVVLISVNDPSLHPEVVALGGAVACARKQDLRPQRLREFWEMHNN